MIVPVVKQTILVDKINVYIAIVIRLVMGMVIVKKIALMIVFNAIVMLRMQVPRVRYVPQEQYVQTMTIVLLAHAKLGVA